MTQCERIIRHLDDYGSISAREAVNEYGIYRLASRIHDLRKSGVEITAETEHTQNRYGEKVCFKRYRYAVKG